MVYALNENHGWSDLRGGVYHRTFLKPLKLVFRETRGYVMHIIIIINPSFVFLRNFLNSLCLKHVLEDKTSDTVEHDVEMFKLNIQDDLSSSSL